MKPNIDYFIFDDDYTCKINAVLGTPMKTFFLITIVLFFTSLCGQENKDTLKTKPKKFTFEGYVDSYYGTTISKIGVNQLPYFVSSNGVNTPNINLAYLSLNYDYSFLRVRVMPGFGTYMESNYAAEPKYLKNMVEGYIGLRIHKQRNIWIDAGILSSPFTNESAVSKNHLMYTRSFAPEYVPYYLLGIKASIPLSNKMTFYAYLINGWQQISDNNNSKSFATQIEYKPNDKHALNFNTYVGNEKSMLIPTNGMRYFADVYWIYNHQKFSATSCVYIGNQKQIEIGQKQSNNVWWQANLIGRYQFTPKVSLSGRIEYFNDNHNVQITPINTPEAFRTYSSGLCLNITPLKNLLFRFEGRYFFSDKNIFVNNQNNPVNNMTWVISNCTISF